MEVLVTTQCNKEDTEKKPRDSENLMTTGHRCNIQAHDFKCDKILVPSITYYF